MKSDSLFDGLKKFGRCDKYLDPNQTISYYLPCVLTHF